jgi:phosphate transport system substrate-binding protein
MKKKIVAAILMASLGMSLAACGSSSDSSAADTTTETEAIGEAQASDDAAAEADTTEASDFDSDSDISVISREDGSGTRGAFIELTGVEEKDGDEKVDMTTEDAQIANSTSVVLTSVAGDDYAIGYISLGALDDTVKALKVDGVEATAENVKSGDYTLARPFNIVTKDGMDNEVAQDFINYIFSEDGQAVVEEEGYIAVDTQDYESTQPEGKITVGGSTSVSPVMEKLIEAYKEVNPNATIELQTSDSTTGVSNTQEGSYDIGMASRDLKDTETGVTAQAIATDGIAVVVNNNNPLSDITTDMIKQIYTGEITTWSEVE